MHNVLGTNAPQQKKANNKQQQFSASQTFKPTSSSFETTQQTNAQSTNPQQNDQSKSRNHNSDSQNNTLPGSSMQPANIPMNQQQPAEKVTPFNVPTQTHASNVQNSWTLQSNHIPSLSNYMQGSQYSLYGDNSSAYYNRFPYNTPHRLMHQQSNYYPSTSYGTPYNVANMGIPQQQQLQRFQNINQMPLQQQYQQNQQDLFLPPNILNQQQNFMATNPLSMAPSSISYQSKPDNESLAFSHASHLSNPFTQAFWHEIMRPFNTQSSQQTMNSQNELQQTVQKGPSTSSNTQLVRQVQYVPTRSQAMQQTPSDMRSLEPNNLTQSSSRGANSSNQAYDVRLHKNVNINSMDSVAKTEKEDVQPETLNGEYNSLTNQLFF